MKFRYTLMFGLLLMSLLPVQAQEGDTMYIEEITGYSYIDGQVFRYEMKREFFIRGFTNNIGGNGSTSEITYLDGKQGLPITVEEPYLEANFDLESSYHSNGSLEQIDWNIFMTRRPNTGLENLEPFIPQKFQILYEGENQRFDLRNTADYFSINLQYFILTNHTDGTQERMKVNTDLTTNNDPSGKIKSTSIHTITRNLKLDIISEFHWSIHEENFLWSIVNWFDQPAMWVPLELGFLGLIVYIYIRVHKFISENKVTLVKKKNVDENEEESIAAK